MRLISHQAVLLASTLLLSVVAHAAEQRMVRVAVLDDTDARRIPAKAEIWFRGHGSVWLHKTCDRLSNGSLSCGPINLGMRDVGQPLDLIVYPNGRHLDGAGRETGQIKAVFKMTSDMCRAGCARDMITVWISDTEVEVSGSPIMAQHSKVTLTFKRQ